MRISSYTDLQNFNLKLSMNECYLIQKHIEFRKSFPVCTEQVNMLEHAKKFKDGNGLALIFMDNSDLILKSEELLKTFLNLITDVKVKIDMGENEIKKIAPYLTKEQFKKSIKIESYCEEYIILVKDINNEYIFMDEDLNNLIIQKPNVLESLSFLNDLSVRNRDFCIALNKAYLIGGKGLTELLGQKVSINRKKKNVEMHELLNKNLSINIEDKIDEIFKDHDGDFYKFKEEIVNYDHHLIKFHKNRTVKIKTISYDGFKKLVDSKIMTHVKFEIGEIHVDQINLYYIYGLEDYKHNLLIKDLIFEDHDTSIISTQSYHQEDGEYPLIKFIKQYQPVFNFEVSYSNPNYIDLMILLEKNIDFKEKAQVLNNLTQIFKESIVRFEVEHAEILENNGVIFDREIIELIIKEKSSNLEVLKWINSRIGQLSDFMVDENQIYGEKAEFSETGIRVLTSSEFLLESIKKNLKGESSNFSEFSVEELSVSQKKDLIKFIENEIDPNYKKLNLLSTNLEELSLLNSFSKMITFDSFSNDELFEIFSIPKNMQGNKKLIKGLKDFIAIKGVNFLMRVKIFKEVSSLFNDSIEYNFNDFVDYSNLDQIEENPNFKQIRIDNMLQIIHHKDQIGLLLQNKDKSVVFRFLRSTGEQGPEYIDDIFELINSILKGLEGIKQRLLIDDLSEYMREELKKSQESIKERLIEVSNMDHCVHIHDRLVPLANFIKKDPLQPLGLDKFAKLEKSKSVIENVGHKLYFPKTRGDLQELGDLHGWGVNSVSSYADGAISNGNIFVTFCPPDSEGKAQDALSLAHFMRKKDGSYYIEQLKWSSKVKGRRNVQAINDFKHNKALLEIKSHLEQIKDKP